MSNKNLSRLLPTPSTLAPFAFPLVQELHRGNCWAQLLIPFLGPIPKESESRVDAILELLLIRWPSLEQLAAELEECLDDGSKRVDGVERYRVLRLRLIGYLAPLGLAETRADRIIDAVGHIDERGWPVTRAEALRLEGYDGYAADSYLMFVIGFLPARRPKDTALSKYWDWAVAQSHVTVNCKPKTA